MKGGYIYPKRKEKEDRVGVGGEWGVGGLQLLPLLLMLLHMQIMENVFVHFLAKVNNMLIAKATSITT